MKNIIRTFVFTLLFSGTIVAQVPTGFSYQAIARDASGELLAGQSLTVEVSILAGGENGILVWQETHETTTSETGLINMVICGDNRLRTGGLVSQVSDIPWATGNNFIGLKIKTAEGTTNLGATKIQSVPYSLVSATTAQQSNTLSIQPTIAMPDDEALFIVKRADGYPIFAVYESGVRVFTDDSNTAGKGIKGGFAVGGYTSGKGLGQTYLSVTPDSTRINVSSPAVKGIKGGFAVGGYTSAKQSQPLTLLSLSSDSARIYVDDDPASKGIKGGFAVGGYTSGKGTSQEYLRVTQDSTRVYLNADPNRKGLKGGFAVGGYSTGKAEKSTFMTLEPENYFIGHNSGGNITTGLYNSVMGYESGLYISEGSSNSFIGYQAGYLNSIGTGNLFLGYQTGYNNVVGNYNTFLGYRAGYANSKGINNTFLGSFSGQNNADGGFNTFVGDSSGYSNTGGYANTFVGTSAGLSNTIGYSNVMIGTASGYGNTEGGMNVFIGHLSGEKNLKGWNNIFLGTETGENNRNGEGNVYLGYQSGNANQDGVRNVFIGNRAGFNELGSNKLYITNWDSDSANSLVWGDFMARKIRFNHEVGINTNPVGPLSVNWKDGAAYIRAFGDGNGFDYSGLVLHGPDTTISENIVLSHTVKHGVYLGQQRGENYYPRLTIDSLGNVGINANSGSESLFVNDPSGNADLLLRGTGDGNNYAQIMLESGGTTPATSYALGHSTDNKFNIVYFDGTNYQPRLQVTSEGRVAINSWEEPTEVLDVNGNARFRGVGTATSANDLRITADGTLTTSTSDARLKTALRPITNSLERVLQLEGVTFRWKDDNSGTEDVGLVAQDVAEVFPEAVFVNQNDGYMGVNYSRFPALLIEAMKEQQQIIDTQKAQLEKQEVLVNELIQRIEKLESTH